MEKGFLIFYYGKPQTYTKVVVSIAQCLGQCSSQSQRHGSSGGGGVEGDTEGFMIRNWFP